MLVWILAPPNLDLLRTLPQDPKFSFGRVIGGIFGEEPLEPQARTAEKNQDEELLPVGLCRLALL